MKLERRTQQRAKLAKERVAAAAITYAVVELLLQECRNSAGRA